MKKLILFSLSILAATAARAQQAAVRDDLDRRVDVSRDYTPAVGSAVKLGIRPDMVDTVALRPAFDYDVRPRVWIAGFDARPIDPARVSTVSYEALRPFYLKAGGGLPGQSLVDLYVTTPGRGRSAAGLWVNHAGRYSGMMDDGGHRVEAPGMENSVGVFGRTGFGRYDVSARAGVDYDRYGRFRIVDGPVSPDVTGGRRQHYSVPHAAVSLGNDFSDLSYLNFRIGADGYVLEDKWDNREGGFGSFLELRRKYSTHQIALRAEYGAWRGEKALVHLANSTVSAGGTYSVEDTGVAFVVGGSFAYDMRDSEGDKAWLLPRFSLSYDGTGGRFVPFVALDSRLVANSYRTLSRQNPYILAGMAPVPRSAPEYGVRGGFSGNLSSRFSYTLYAGAALVRGAPVFANIVYADGATTDFIALSERKLRSFFVGADIELRVVRGVSLTGAVRYTDHKTKTFPVAAGLADLGGSVGVAYANDRFRIRASAEYIGERDMLVATIQDPLNPVWNYTGERHGATVDITLEAEYAVTPRMAVFAEGRNIANRKTYRMNHYPGYGASGSVGVKVTF